ncbi:MAG: energy-coupling factor transporter ATPase [Limnochordia bacterium]|nr:energy-coupling factor transporter ATPase [Bacillota bacterium]NLH31835.1 energy-coupling factor transporter ATPase [Bacillota bacterium]HOB09165.1 energy-coupling factor transporter ATPase [Limnochordia bacterium]HPT92943.1 energy-coupling factor transporter ATPase [Limnochordia bacterium]HQD70906.1 energy-coupling factor transporter ATPase [Limnochordia bacterium]
MDALIRFVDVSFSYSSDAEHELEALADINLDIDDGEFVAVLGHNGSGKSTLAKHMNALLVPTSGKVYVAGIDTQNAERLWEIRQMVGMVFQNPDNQLVATTVEEDVAFGPENLGVPTPEIHRRVDEALAVVGMSDYRLHSPHQLSGGQKQRVAIAGMIAMRPRCVVLDEPTAMLDPVGRREVMQTVIKLNREEKITIVLITHAMEEAILADRVIVMEEGRIVMTGTPREVFSKVETLAKLRLDVPEITSLANRLRQRGFDQIPNNILTIEEMVNVLCQFG